MCISLNCTKQPRTCNFVINTRYRMLTYHMLPYVLCSACVHSDELGQARNRLLDGLKKLDETNALVASMKADLARLQPELESKAAATADLLVKVWIVSLSCHIT